MIMIIRKMTEYIIYYIKTTSCVLVCNTRLNFISRYAFGPTDLS